MIVKNILIGIGLILASQPVAAQTPPLFINWDHTLIVSGSTPTYQVVVNPMLREGSPIYEQAFDAIRNLEAGYVRYGVWYPYPKLGVAELEAPDEDRTYWDFSLIDPMTLDFLEATEGHTSILNFCTIPQWMFKTEEAVPYPDDPNEIYFDYNVGTELRDTTLQELAGYYQRLISWYTQGGFTDELGEYHESGHHFSLPYWEVLNEPELEHNTTPEDYTRRYDAIVNAIQEVSPETKFIGMATPVYWDPYFFEYFLNPDNHEPGTPIDMISYHFYAGGSPGQTLEDYQYTYFDKADAFLTSVDFIENIRKRLAPDIETAINELGTFLTPEMRRQPIPAEYWNLSASVYAYLFIELSKRGVEIIGQSQLVGYPGQFPDVSMLNWETGQPNARYRTLKMIIDHFSPGDSLMETTVGIMTPSDYAAQAFITKEGRKKMLFLNKRKKTLQVKVPDNLKGAKLSVVDITTGEDEPAESELESNVLELKPYAVVVATLKE